MSFYNTNWIFFLISIIYMIAKLQVYKGEHLQKTPRFPPNFSQTPIFVNQ